MEDLSDQGKLFVGGISWETSEETLTQHFSRYGTVVGCVIARDRLSGNPRGFAFVSFSDPDAVRLALIDTHDILGRTVEVKKAIPRSEQHQSKQQQQQQLHRSSRTKLKTADKFRTKKIFVGGLSANLSEDEFKGYFETFGRITDVVVMHDNVTHRPRGFGFITFDSEDAVEKVVQNNFHQLNGKQVEVKRAVPKEGNNSSSNSYNGRIGGGSNYNTYQQSSYPSFSPRYEIFPSYGSITGFGGLAGYCYGPGIFGSNYPSGGGYVGISYGVAPFAPTTPWDLSFRGSPLPLDNSTTSYPYLSGGVRHMYTTTSGYNGITDIEVGGISGSDGGVQRKD